MDKKIKENFKNNNIEKKQKAISSAIEKAIDALETGEYVEFGPNTEAEGIERKKKSYFYDWQVGQLESLRDKLSDSISKIAEATAKATAEDYRASVTSLLKAKPPSTISSQEAAAQLEDVKGLFATGPVKQELTINEYIDYIVVKQRDEGIDQKPFYIIILNM